MSSYVLESGDGLTAVLVADDPLYALGPVIVGDLPGEAREAMDAFTAGLDTPADEQPTIALMVQWRSFIEALAELQLAASGAASPPEPADQATADPTPETPSQGSPQPPQGVSGVTPGQTTVDEQIAAVDAQAGSDGGGGDQSADRAFQRATAPVCWSCGGSGRLNLAGEEHTCNVCDGSGRLAAVPS